MASSSSAGPSPSLPRKYEALVTVEAADCDAVLAVLAQVERFFSFEVSRRVVRAGELTAAYRIVHKLPAEVVIDVLERPADYARPPLDGAARPELRRLLGDGDELPPCSEELPRLFFL